MPASDPRVTIAVPQYALSQRRHGLFERVRNACRCLWGHPDSERLQAELVATLNDVADAVSSAMEADDVLDTVVTCAKKIARADKAALALTDHHGEQLDFDTLVVHGAREQHPQEWWGDWLAPLAAEAFRSGQPMIENHPSQGADIIVCPVAVNERPIGLLAIINSSDRPITMDRIDALQILCSFAANTIENAQLAEQGRYVLLASERSRIAREMHDGVVQSLFSISLGLEVCKKAVTRDPVMVTQRLDDLQNQLNVAMAELRRYIYDLRPMKLAEFGLEGAVEYWIREVTQGAAVRGRLLVKGPMPPLRPSEEACLYRVAKESIANIVKHAGAREFNVTIEFEPDAARLLIIDDGVGFDIEGVMDGGTTGIGISSIQARLQREGGTLHIEPIEPSGTRLIAVLPIAGRS